MSQLTHRVERDLREIAAGASPSASAWDSIVRRLDDDAEPEVVLAPAFAGVRRRGPTWPAIAAAALLVVAVSIAVLTSIGDDGPVSTTATVDFPEPTTTFVSPRNGFSVSYADRGEGSVTPATQLWGFGDQPDDSFDVVETGLAAVFKGGSGIFPGDFPCLSDEAEPIPCGSIDDRIDEHVADVLPGTCGVPRSQQAEITIDGQSGTISECPKTTEATVNEIEATVVAGGRLYLFILLSDRSDYRAVFDAFAATIDLRPEDAAVR